VTATPLLRCNEVTVRVGARALVDAVSFDAHPGELLTIVGPNGAGKSTLLGAIAGDRKPGAGEVLIGGRPVHRWAAAELARMRAVLPQGDTLAFPFTALEVVLIGRAPHVKHAETPEDERLARAALASVAMGAFADRIYTTLSGGERQRVQLARALAQLAGLPPASPRLLLLDEPTSSLDLLQQHRVLGLARRMAREGACVLAVLHDLNLASQYADRVAVMARGKLVGIGIAEEVLDVARMRDVFGVDAHVVRSPETGARVLVVADEGGEAA
jgi:iron complex transport system ATP-binding protein